MSSCRDDMSVYISGPESHIDMRVLQTTVSGIPRVLGISTRMLDSYVYVVVGAPTCNALRSLGQLPYDGSCKMNASAYPLCPLRPAGARRSQKHLCKTNQSPRYRPQTLSSRAIFVKKRHQKHPRIYGNSPPSCGLKALSLRGDLKLCRPGRDSPLLSKRSNSEVPDHRSPKLLNMAAAVASGLRDFSPGGEDEHAFLSVRAVWLKGSAIACFSELWPVVGTVLAWCRDIPNCPWAKKTLRAAHFGFVGMKINGA